MGASVSICNLTTVIINVALRHASPLYYHNELLPTKCANFSTGRVWFTVEAKVWANGTNNYNDAQVQLPIVGASLVAPVVVGLIAGVSVAGKRRQQELDTGTTTVEPTVRQINDSSLDEGQKQQIRNEIMAGLAAVGTVAAALPGTFVGFVGGLVNIDNNTPEEWKVQKIGVYMSDKKVIFITGGPEGNGVHFGNNSQIIDQNSFFNPLNIIEVIP